MSEGGKTQAPVPRTRPAGSRRSQQPACTPEGSGVRRSTRSRSNVAPTPPESVETQRSRKASKTEEHDNAECGPSMTMEKLGAEKLPAGKLPAEKPSAGKLPEKQNAGKLGTETSRPGKLGDGIPGKLSTGGLSARGGEADLDEAAWGSQRARESISTYGSRVLEHLREYEEASKTLGRLQEEVRVTKALASTTSKGKRQGLSATIERLKKEIKTLEVRRTYLRENSGPFREKLENEDRFRCMREEKVRRLRGLQPESQVDEEEDVVVEESMEEDDQLDPPGSLQQHQQTPYSGPPAEQTAMSSSCSSAGSGEDSDSSAKGGALMAQIRQLESPVHLQNFCFGDELPEEAPRGKKKKTTAKKSQEQISLRYVPLPVPPVLAAGSACCVSPTTQPRPSSAVDLVQESGEITKSNMALSSVPACSSRDKAEKASAERPDSFGGPVASKQSFVSGAVVRSPVGGGGGSVPEIVAEAPVALSAVTDACSAGRRREGVAGAGDPGPPNQTVPGKVLFCIGAAGPIDQQRPDGAGIDADEAEGTNKNRVGVVSKLARQASQTLKGTLACPVGVSPALVPRDAEAIQTTVTTSEKQGLSYNVSVAGPVSLNVGINGGAGSRTGGNVNRGAGNRTSDDVNRGAGSRTGGDVNRGVGSRTVGDMNRGAGNRGGGDDMNGGGGGGMEICTAQDSGVGAGPGPVAPPAVAAPVRSYANVATGGSRVPSSSPGSRDGVLQRRLLEALKKGERSINVEGREVDLSFWIERHGLAAFREERGGETVWSLPTAGPGSFRRNVVRLRWRGSDTCPPRAKVVELLLKMGFKAIDIYALIHPYGTPEFDVSFVRPEGLELFWSNYELAKNEPGWRDFALQVVSRQNEIKRVTVLTRNESLSCVDIMTWLGRYGEVMEIPKKNRDEFGIWSGAWTFVVKLKRSGNTVTHIPSAAFLGRDRIQIFYQGQPKLCHRCGDPTHFSANCTVQKCALCGGVGHLAASCAEIRCHLCGDLGHPFSRCPRSFANAVVAPVGESREADSAGEGTSRGGGTEGPVRRGKEKTPAQLRRLDKRQKDREMGESRVSGTTPDPVPEANLAAEALRDGGLDEEIRRIQDEEGAISSESSHCDGMDEDSRRWLERKQGTKKKKKKGDLRSSPTLVQVSKEGKTDSPLVNLSNRFRALDNISSSSSEGEAEGEGPEVAVGPTGGTESFSPGEAMSSGGGTGLESGDEDGKFGRSGDMDTSVSLKRGKGSCSDVEDRKGSGKKKAV